MELVADTYEYSTKDLIGHGAFAVVYRGRYIEVRFYLLFSNPKSFSLFTKRHNKQ